MGTIKKLRIVLLGALVLALALLITRKPTEQRPPKFPFAPPIEMERQMPAAVQGGTSEAQVAGSSDASGTEASATQSSEQPAAEQGQVAEAAEEEESGADSTEGEAPEFDPEEVRAEAMAEVRQFDEELAGTLWTFNPNARKTRLKAAELKERAENIDQWIKTQDNRTDWSAEEKREWEAQREVWLDHSSELKRVSQRLSSSRGTRRKVRNIARDMKDRLERKD